MTDPAPIVAFDGIAQQYKLLRVLNGVTLDVRRGDFSVIYGPPATGKSVLMRILVGLEEPTAGRILLRGFEATRIPAADRNIGYVPQSFALYPHLSVHDNIGYPLALGGMSSRDAEPIVRHAADMLRISEHLGKRPDQLSGGQKQRVAIARGIAKQTDLFVLDDPLAGLDFKLREQLVEDLRRLQSDTQATFLYTTSDVVEAMTLADTLSVLDGGRIAQSGPPERLYQRPDNLRAMHLVGFPPANFLPATLVGQGGALRCRTGLFEVPVDITGPLVHDVVVGLRPEHVRLTPGVSGNGRPRAGDGVSMPAQVLLREDLGGEEIVYLGINGQSLTAVDRHQLPAGELPEATMTIDPADLLVFRADSGELIGHGAGATDRSTGGRHA